MALARLDALLVEAQRTTVHDPEVLRLRVAYAERQWGQQRGTVILRSNTQLLDDITDAGTLSPEETGVVALLAAVERYCDDPADSDSKATLLQIESAAAALTAPTVDNVDAAAMARSFARLVVSVRSGHRALNDAVKMARARAMPELMVRSLAYASGQSRLALLTSEWARVDG